MGEQELANLFGDVPVREIGGHFNLSTRCFVC